MLANLRLARLSPCQGLLMVHLDLYIISYGYRVKDHVYVYSYVWTCEGLW